MKKVMLLASKDMCDILQHTLNDRYITLPCTDPAVGASLLEPMPDALILALSLPGADGLTFLRTYTYHLPPVILVFTPFLSLPLLQDLTALGVSSVFLIPCRMSYFVKALAKQLQ